MNGITIEHLDAAYGTQPVLRDTNLAVPAGALACLLGPSGCGKTTLLRVIAGFEPATAGTVRLADRVAEDSRRREPPERRRVGYVPQDGALFPHLSVIDNIAFGVDTPRRQARRDPKLQELIGLAGLDGLQDRYPHQLSGGQQQRVAVARALAPRPDVILLDEPFAALDASLRHRLRRDIQHLLRTTAVTALLVTHDRDEALTLGDLVAVMHDGHIHQTGSPAQVYDQPADTTTAAFIGDANLLPGHITNRNITTPLGTFPLHPDCPDHGPHAIAVIRPEHLTIHPDPSAPDPAAGPQIKARVVSADYYGHSSRLELVTDHTDQSVPLIARTTGGFRIDVGQFVAVTGQGPVWAVPDLQPTRDRRQSLTEGADHSRNSFDES